jgi:hypothetical protein
MPRDPAGRSGPNSVDGFFCIDSRIWARAANGGINQAVAYLVLACGTGHGNKETKWSTTAVMKYAGVGWERAKAALVQLIADGLILCTDDHTEAHPCYQLATYRELMDYEHAKNPPAAPDYFECELIAELQAGKQPKNRSGRTRAECLRARGLLSKDAQGIYTLPEPGTEDAVDCSIWLPNAIVKGTLNGEESPVQRLRSAGSIWTLRLFVDLYSAQNLRDDGGINPRLVGQPFDRQKVGQLSAYTIWGFKPRAAQLWWTGPFEVHRNRTKVGPKDDHPAWESMRLLQSMGLLSFVPHIFENDTDVAEPIHVFGVGETAEAPIEREIGIAADRAARAMCLPSRLENAEENGFRFFCPILHTIPSAQMIGVARLTYRPHTRRTAAWFAQLHQAAPGWIDLFGNLAEKGKIAGSQRMVNYS